MLVGFAPDTHMIRGGDLEVLRVHEHPLNVEVHPLTAKASPQNGRKLNETPFQTDIRMILYYPAYTVSGRIAKSTIRCIPIYSTFSQSYLYSRK